MTNNQAEAYAKKALELQQIDPDKIERILASMRYLFDTYTEEEIYRKMFGCNR